MGVLLGSWSKEAESRTEIPQPDGISIREGCVLSTEDEDTALQAKIQLITNAIDEIGMTTYHWKLFVLNGFGYAVDSQLLFVHSVIASQAALEFKPSYEYGLTITLYVGALVGALFWGISADIVGRKFAFNTSLLISSIFAIAAGAAPDWIVLGLFVSLSAFGAGGNLVLDTAVFLEYLPTKDQWLVTVMASWWGLGQLIAGLLAWAFLPNFSCSKAASCTYAENKGWRYVWYTNGALVLAMSIARLTIIRLEETPKFLVGQGKDAKIVDTVQGIATKYNRPCSLTLAQLESCGTVTQGRQRHIYKIWPHLQGLFSNKRLGLSTTLIWLSWLLIGLAYPLYNVFLPSYLASRGADLGETSASNTWKEYAITNVCSIPGPILAGYMCKSRWFWGRRGTMAIGALATMAFLFAYTQVRSNAQNLAFTCCISFCLNIYYGTLYAYTPEVIPAAHRGTGNGIAIGCNRVMGIMSAVIATVANTTTSIPIYICAALYIVIGLVSILMPYEPNVRERMTPVL